MRWTFLMPADDLGGGNRVVATYAKCLQKLGHEVLVVSNALINQRFENVPALWYVDIGKVDAYAQAGIWPCG